MVVATKELTFVNHKMGSKKVHLIAGFGAASATKLAQKGYAKAEQVYYEFRQLTKAEFNDWLEQEAGLKRLHRDMVVQCLENYKSKWGDQIRA